MALLPPEHLQTTKVIHSRWLFKGVMVHEKKANAGHRLIKIHPVQQELPEFRPVYRQASCIKVDPSISTTSMSFFFFLAIAVSNDHCFPAVGKTPCWQNTIALHVDGGESRNFLSFNPWPALGRSYTACVSFLQPWVTGKKNLHDGADRGIPPDEQLSAPGYTWVQSPAKFSYDYHQRFL